jgi:predicted nuclease of predicted toxin-antitoxin system
MRFLVDNAISLWVAIDLKELCHDAVHVCDYGLQKEDDSNLTETVTAQLEAGSILIIEEARIRIRTLPLFRKK